MAEPLTNGQPLNNGQNTCPHSLFGSSTVYYVCVCVSDIDP